MKKSNYPKNFLIIITAIAFILCVLTSYFAYKSDKLNKELAVSRNDYKMVSEKLEVTNEKLQQSMLEIDMLNQDILDIQSDMFDSEQTYGIIVRNSDVDMIAKTVYGEARGLNQLEQSAVVWCILNRVDAGYGSIKEVITAQNQFEGYSPSNPVTEEIRMLVRDVLARWQMEKICVGNVGRTLPSNYLWFHGDTQHNHFRNSYGGNYITWNWNCYNPYS